MSSLLDWLINLKPHEIALWAIIVLLLIWEFVLQRRMRRPLETELRRLREEFIKLGFSTELSKKEISELYKKFAITEKEIERIKREAQEHTQPVEPKAAAKSDRLAIRDDHLFVLKLLGSAREKRSLANFVLVYYLNVFKDKDKNHYKEILSELIDHELIDFQELSGKTYMTITEKGLEYLHTIEVST